MSGLLLIFFVAAVVALWWHFETMHRFALAAVRRHCQQMDVQLLDQTVVLRGLGFRRSGSSLFGLAYKYHFEFSTTGERRYQGSTELIGRRLSTIEMEAHVIH